MNCGKSCASRSILTVASCLHLTFSREVPSEYLDWSELSNGGRGRTSSSLGTWRSRISIIAGIKAGASFLSHVPLSFLPGALYLLSSTGFFLLKVLFRHIIETNACPLSPVRASTATTFATLSCGLRTFFIPPLSSSPRFFYLLPFYENC